jgi:hypothetical protein
MAAAQSAKAQLCPNPPWDGSISDYTDYNGCTYHFTFCYRIDNLGYHCIAIAQIEVIPPCDGDDFEANMQDVTDAIIIRIAKNNELRQVKGWEGLEIPECPATTCFLKIYDAICYHGWIYNDVTGFYEMDKCDDLIRTCNETAYVCWELINGNQVARVVRQGFMQGTPCDESTGENCHTNCGK